MIIRIKAEGPNGWRELVYNDSYPNPLMMDGPGEAPVEDEALHTMLEVGLNYAMRKKYGKVSEQ